MPRVMKNIISGHATTSSQGRYLVIMHVFRRLGAVAGCVQDLPPFGEFVFIDLAAGELIR